MSSTQSLCIRSKYSDHVALLTVFCYRLADLAIECELDKAPTNQQLLSVLANREDVENALSTPVTYSEIIYKNKQQHIGGPGD